MPRAIWSGAISFVPVRMFPATESKEPLPLSRTGGGEPLPKPETEEGGEVVDLMAALRESVERTKKQRRRPAKRKAS
jgi:non-homologous end joining protein Ku